MIFFFHSNRQGGSPCVFKFTPKPSSNVTSVSATFDSIGEISLTKLPNDVEYLGLIPGLNPVSRYFMTLLLLFVQTCRTKWLTSMHKKRESRIRAYHICVI